MSSYEEERLALYELVKRKTAQYLEEEDEKVKKYGFQRDSRAGEKFTQFNRECVLRLRELKKSTTFQSKIFCFN